MSIQHLDCILLDLDGLLVDTEEFHYRAYKAMCQFFGVTLPWDCAEYLRIAGASSSKIKEQLQFEFPELFENHSWSELYATKQDFVLELLEKGPIPLMPYVEEALNIMVLTTLPIVVVTNSSARCVDLIRSAHSIFSPISLWITREQYKDPKPSPDCYISALRRLHISPERALGFEDTFKGICALKQAGCKAVLVNDKDATAQDACKKMRVKTYPSLACVPTVLLVLEQRSKLCG